MTQMGICKGEFTTEEEALAQLQLMEGGPNAKGIREDAGQVHQRGDVSGGSEEKGGADLQQQAPVSPPSYTQTPEVSPVPFKRKRGRPRKNF